jgi:superfamily I DNA/RNA helicase
MSLAFQLLRKRVGCIMLGRDIGKSLIALIKKIAPDEATGAPEFITLVKDWMASEESLARANEKPERIAAIKDRGESLIAVAEFSGASTVKEIKKRLEALFKRENGVVTLSSIHRAKGLEWDMVMHLDPWRIPSRYAKEALSAGDPSQMQQELNLRYVCETRTKNILVMANVADFA